MEISLDLGENDYDPEAFVEATVYAEEMGFSTAWFGDHFYPWYHSGKKSAFVWSVLGVALEKTDQIKVGPWVTVPIGVRYHPAIIAQASATLDNMYPGRLYLGVGTGEALNEAPFWNGRWPKWKERMDRLAEGIRLIRQMWESEEPFQFEGKYFSSDFYYLYTKQKCKIPIYMSAIGKRAAHAAGMYSDGLITISPRNNIQKLKEVVLPAYRQGRVEANSKGPEKISVGLVFSFKKPEELIKTAWRALGIHRKDSWSIPNPVAVEEEGRKVTLDDIKRNTHFLNNWKDLVSLIESYMEIGVNEVCLGSGCDKELIRSYAENVLDVF